MKLGAFYSHKSSVLSMVQPVDSTPYGYRVLIWTRGYAGRPFLVDPEPVLLLYSDCPNYVQVPPRVLDEPKSEAGALWAEKGTFTHWYTRGTQHGHC